MPERDDKRLIFHIDVNSAFLSWEAARRVKNGEPDLRSIPSAVGGDREKRTGVILAKSIPAKKYGITTGESVASAIRKYPELVLVKPDFKLYTECSRAFIAILHEYSPIVEQYSIDECFLDMTGTELLYPDPISTAHEIKNRIRDTLGFTVNIGIARNRLCAKMASDFEKPDRVHTLFPEEIPEKMWGLPIGELFLVGRSTAERLERVGLSTIGRVAACPEDVIKSIVGSKMGKVIHDYSLGIDDSAVTKKPPEAKGYSVSTTTEKDITTADEAHSLLLSLADSVTSRLRADEVMCRCISVTIRTSYFIDRSHQSKVDATDLTSEVYSTAKRLFDELWDGRTPLRLLGIALTDLTRERFVQFSLFYNESDEKARERARRLDRTVDEIRKKYGSSTLSFGAMHEHEVGKKFKLDPSAADKGSSRNEPDSIKK